MKTYHSFLKFLYIVFPFLLASCVHDDVYDAPDLSAQCADLTANVTMADVKAKYNRNAAFIYPEDSKDVLEAYVSSSDETGNVYKTLFIQDKPENPTQGMAITVDAVSTYLKYPQGSKIYIKLAGLAVGAYNGQIQIGVQDMDPTNTFVDAVARISEEELAASVIKSCSAPVTIVPKEMTLADMKTLNDQYLGVLVKVKNAEFHRNELCKVYAPNGESVNRSLVDPTFNGTARVVRNSGYATFADEILPSGNGDFVGVLSKFGSTYQLYVNRPSDLNLTGERLDKLVAPCSISAAEYPAKTVAEVKAMLGTGLTKIEGKFSLKGKVTANDQTGNLYKYFYMEDATGGIRVNVNMLDMYLDPRFTVGKEVIVNLEGLYLQNVNGEIQLGGLFNGNFGQIEGNVAYKTFFQTQSPITQVIPTERTITTLKPEDVGRFIKIKDLQFDENEMGKTYADGTSTSNRILEDCNGNTITLRTSGFADFAGALLDTGKGDVYGVLSVYNGTYQLWIQNRLGADLDGPRCDGTNPQVQLVYTEMFTNLNNWTATSITGAEVWKTQITSGNSYAIMSGFNSGNKANEDWLISKPITLAGGSKFLLSFDSDTRYAGNVMEVFISENYTNSVTAATWTKLNAPLDPNANAWGFFNTGNLDISQYAGKNITLAFKYTSTTAAAATWEVDNIRILGVK